MTTARPLAVLVAHGQPSAPEQPEAQLAAVAEACAKHLPGWEVRSATLSMPGRLEQVVQGGAVIYPFFMAQGWFTGKVLPRRLEGKSYRMACPFGLDAALPGLAAASLASELASRGWGAEASSVLLAAHGSARGPKAAEAAESFADKLARSLPVREIRCGYVEQEPSISATARTLPAQTLCLPFFAQSGDHVKGDVPEALEAAGFQGALLPVSGTLPGVPALIAEAIRRSAEDTGSKTAQPVPAAG